MAIKTDRWMTFFSKFSNAIVPNRFQTKSHGNVIIFTAKLQMWNGKLPTKKNSSNSIKAHDKLLESSQSISQLFAK